MSIYTMGIDVGSTASKCVIMKDGQEIVAKSLVPVGTGTSGPARAIAEVLDNAKMTREQMDFVLGQRIQLSKNHPRPDICDKLQGDYPKDFVFDGWHAQCFCFATPILMDEEEMAKVTAAFLKGEKYTPRGKQITEYPANFKHWVRDNKENILAQ